MLMIFITSITTLHSLIIILHKILLQKQQYQQIKFNPLSQKMKVSTQILTCPGTVLYKITNHHMQFNTSGLLHIYLSTFGTLSLELNNFQYNINSLTQIIYDLNDPQFHLILFLKSYQEHDLWIVKINQNVDQVFSCLNQKCKMKNKNQHHTQHQHLKQSSNNDNLQQLSHSSQKNNAKINKCQEQVNREQLPLKKHINTHDVIVGASKGIGIGLSFTGKVISKGFQAMGTLVSKYVKPSQKVEVSESTKANIQFSKKTSKNVLNFASTQVTNLLKFGKQTVTSIGQRFEKTQKGKQLQQNSKYTTAKQTISTGAQSIANIYSGVVNAVYDIGSGISKGTTKVLSQKYGTDAGQAADGILQGVGNVAKITRIPQDSTANVLK